MVEIKPLSKHEHAKIYRILTTDIDELFVVKLISSLVYFHGLTSKMLVEIKVDNILLGRNCILIPERPPAYLSDLEMLLLHLTLSDRLDRLNGKSSAYLFCSYRSITDTSIKINTVNRYVKSLTGISPKNLRIAALQYCSANFGAEYLHNCLGLSVTQASRYADMGEWLLEEIIDDEIKS